MTRAGQVEQRSLLEYALNKMELRVIIIEDEKHGQEALQELLKTYCPEVKVLSVADTVELAKEQIIEHKPDVVFLDIELQSGTGFDILEALESIDFSIIFTTAFEAYALRAIKFSSLDYLLKPINPEELKAAVGKAHHKKNRDIYEQQIGVLIRNLKHQPVPDKICLSTSQGLEFVNVDDIIYCEAQGAYTNFILKYNRTLMVSKNIKEYEKLLGEHLFMRVHNNALINLKEVKKYVKSQGGYIVMSNGASVGVSRRRKDQFLNAIDLLLK